MEVAACHESLDLYAKIDVACIESLYILQLLYQKLTDLPHKFQIDPEDLPRTLSLCRNEAMRYDVSSIKISIISPWSYYKWDYPCL